MNERLLHFIWQQHFYSQGSLSTIEGEPVQVIQAGRYNSNQGPDFLEARIRIGHTVLIGSVEIHVRSSDWHKHGHSIDANYNNVILHVVYEHDQETGLPELELKGRIPRQLSEHYEGMMAAQSILPCASSLASVKPLTITSWKERLLMERLDRRSAEIFAMLEANQYHWEESLWWLLAKNMGGQVNAAAFELVARSLPLVILLKHREQIHQLEALLFGQAGLLEEGNPDGYAAMLKREYVFLNKKYKLKPVHASMQFLRMRPGNFPTIRLAQLAMLLYSCEQLFAAVINEKESGAIRRMLSVTANDYWHYHYRFNEESKYCPKKLGSMAIDHIIINTVVPVLFAYGLYKKETALQVRALQWLEQTDKETNVVTKEFSDLGLEHRTAFDSQAFAELKKHYCSQKKCLQCAIGNAVLKALPILTPHPTLPEGRGDDDSKS